MICVQDDLKKIGYDVVSYFVEKDIYWIKRSAAHLKIREEQLKNKEISYPDNYDYRDLEIVRIGNIETLENGHYFVEYIRANHETQLWELFDVFDSRGVEFNDFWFV